MFAFTGALRRAERISVSVTATAPLALDHHPYNRFRLIERLKYKEISGEVMSQAKIIALEEIIFLSQMNIFCNCRLSIS